MENDILTHIGQAERMAYAICNAQREITHHSPILPQFVTPTDQITPLPASFVGHPVENLFDELIGLEPDLELVRQGQLNQLRIDMAARNAPQHTPPIQYITLKVFRFQQDDLLLTVFDVTQQGILAQQLLQQRNEFYFMLNQLQYLHTEMDTVLGQFLSFNASIFRHPPPTE